jgi:anion-transporting  ArsA/GET3 family ATPase
VTARALAGQALSKALAERSVLVVCGSGGVGKTTTSAALGLSAAQLGRRVLVCTIDPSRRLATSLGIGRLSHTPRQLDLSSASPDATGELWAMTLDVKRTFDTLVERYASSPEAQERILRNPYYRQVSSALAGSHEYMAMEKLLELSADARFDLVVLDTPPTRHALDFLDAPDRMLGFLDASVLRFFLKPYVAAGRLTLEVASRTGRALIDIIDKAVGLQFVRDLSEFFLAFEGMYDGFKERAARVHDLLRNPDSGFVLVASPSPLTLEEAVYFHGRLEEKQMPFVSVIVNRVHAEPAGQSRRHTPAPTLAPDFTRRLIAIHDDLKALAATERRAMRRLEVDIGRVPLQIPELDSDVHDLNGLAAVAAMLTPQRRGTPSNKRLR